MRVGKARCVGRNPTGSLQECLSQGIPQTNAEVVQVNVRCDRVSVGPRSDNSISYTCSIRNPATRILHAKGDQTRADTLSDACFDD